MKILSTSEGQAKLEKSVALNVFSMGVNLMPANTLGLFLREAEESEIQKARNLFERRGGDLALWDERKEGFRTLSLCPSFSTCGARGGRNCLLGSGQNWMSQASKVAKTMFYLLHREMFFSTIEKEGKTIFRKKGMSFSGRFNLLSDIPTASMRFHNMMYDLAGDRTYLAYEYTKLPYSTWGKKIDEYNNKAGRESIRIVFSVNKGGGGAGSNNREVKTLWDSAHEAAQYIHNDQSIAIIVPNSEKTNIMQKTEEDGWIVVDGDEHDIRTLDKPRSIVFLSAKGMLRKESRKENTLTDVFSGDEVASLLSKMKVLY
jgi:hypothetical protein